MNKLSAVTFRIQQTPHSIQKVVHYDKLKVYEGPPIARWKRKRPPDDTDHNFNDQHTQIEPESIPVKGGNKIVLVKITIIAYSQSKRNQRYPWRCRRGPKHLEDYIQE